MEDIEYYSIPVYNFPYDEEEDDEETIVDNSELRVRYTSTTRSPSVTPFLTENLAPRRISCHLPSSVPKKTS